MLYKIALMLAFVLIWLQNAQRYFNKEPAIADFNVCLSIYAGQFMWLVHHR